MTPRSDTGPPGPTPRTPVSVNTVNSTVAVPHLGITLRVLFGAVLAAWPDPTPGERRDFTVLHKGVAIATIHVQQHTDIQS